ncbi:MAG TPA: hypothetical protein PK397_10210 [Ignavibacteriaceae bacterium]|nr:hypothetical protein [Ignavibacteriaceae bacterium]
MLVVIRFISLLVIIFFALTETTLSQNDNEDKYWIGGGIGIIVRDLFIGFPKTISGTYYTKNVLVSASFSFATESNKPFFPSRTDRDLYLIKIRETALTIGYAQESKKIIYGIAGGIGYVSGNYNEKRSNESFDAVGFIVNCHGVLKLSDKVGFGIKWGGNLNKEQSFGIITIGLFYGSFF